MTKEHRISFADPAIQSCPFQAYDELRDDQPVYIDPLTGFYVVTRYDDVRKILLDWRNMSNSTGQITTRVSAATEQVNKLYAEKGWLPIDTLVTNDPPAHKMYRTLVDRAFTTQRVVGMEPYIEGIVNELIDGFIDEGEVEFVSRFSVPLPMSVIADQLGVPRQDMPTFKKWSDVSIEIINPLISTEREIEITHDIIAFQHYFAKKIEELRREPRDTLFSDLVHAELDGRRLDMRELLSVLQQLLVAGNETTTNALSGGVRLMIENPQAVETMLREPETILTFVEETLRLCSPIQGLFRKVKHPVEIEGITIPEGAIVNIRYGSANRDPARFPEPGTLDLRRANAGTHLTFGSGIHLCIGNQLARGELRVAFSAIVRRLKNLRFARGADSYFYPPNFIALGPTKLDVGFERR